MLKGCTRILFSIKTNIYEVKVTFLNNMCSYSKHLYISSCHIPHFLEIFYYASKGTHPFFSFSHISFSFNVIICILTNTFVCQLCKVSPLYFNSMIYYFAEFWRKGNIGLSANTFDLHLIRVTTGHLTIVL